MYRFLLLSIAVVISLPAPAASLSAEAYAPALVATEAAPGGGMFISWVPGHEAADSYRIYGLLQQPVFLSEVSSTSETMQVLAQVVPANFEAYGVSGVNAGVESRFVVSFTTIYKEGTDCIVIEPPHFAIDCIPLLGWSTLDSDQTVDDASPTIGFVQPL